MTPRWLGLAAVPFVATAGWAELDVGIAGTAPPFTARSVHAAPTAIWALTLGEIDGANPGPEVAALLSDNGAYLLRPGGPTWGGTRLTTGRDPITLRQDRATIAIGDALAEWPGNEILLSSYTHVSLARREGDGTWSQQIIRDYHEFFGTAWGARLGEIDPVHPGQEILHTHEGVADFSALYYLRDAAATWEAHYIFGAEVAMDIAIGELDSAYPGNEILFVTEMGPAYVLHRSTADSAGPWSGFEIWDNFDDAGWVAKIADIDPAAPGNEVAYGTRYSNRILVSRPDGTGRHQVEVALTGNAHGQPVDSSMQDIAVGDVLPETPGLEIAGVDSTGSTYLAWRSGGAWQGATIWSASQPLHAVIIADFDPTSPGDELLVAGESGLVTLLARPSAALPGDLNCDGAVNFDDIDGFVTALVGRSAYEAAYPSCRYLNGDLDASDAVTFDDIDPFITCLVFGACP